MILATHCFNGRFLHPSPPSSSGSLRLPPLHLTNGHSSSTPCLPSLVKLSSLRPRRVRRLRVRASVQDSSLSSGVPDALDGLQYSPQSYSVRIPVGNRHILVETGIMGKQASGAVTVTDGETIVYTTVCLSDVPSEPTDFFPLSVNYQERFSAAGRTSGGFFKREGRTKDHEVLICRLIDRPLRPTMPKGFYHDTQVLSWVLSYDCLHCPDSLAVTAAGIAMALSEVPTSEPVAGVRVGLVDNKFIVNPTTKEMENSELDLVLAGTENAILMIEGYCNFLTEEKLLEAVQVGQAAVRSICKEVGALVKICGKQKMLDAIRLPPPELYMRVEEIAGIELEKILQIRNKIPRRKAISSLEDKVLTVLTESGQITKDTPPGNTESLADLIEDENEDEEVVVDGAVDEGDVHIKPVSRKYDMLFTEVDVKLVFKEVSSNLLRKHIVEGEKRSDGRSSLDIRSINSRCGLLPRAHGSALFTRGETQSLAVVTLGDRQMAQRIDNLVGVDELKRFYLQAAFDIIYNDLVPVQNDGFKSFHKKWLTEVEDHEHFLTNILHLMSYSFPPSCVGEVGRMGAPSRREIGHGMLAERALEPILPSEEEFPYTMRLESTIIESNGSSSMASVCGGCLALFDAGVPLRCSIAGIAMGLVLDTKEFGGDGTPLILSDITGSEDASGDMDFKVAGNETGVTAFQMDIKVGGITLPVMERALLQAREGRKHVLAEMLKSSPPPSMKLSKYAPLIHVMKVKPEKVNLIIGTGGKKIKSIIEECGIEAIDTQDDGIVKITAKDTLSLEKSKAIISSLTMVPTVGDIYRNCEIKSIAPYGAFVEIAPGREGLCHISELSANWLEKAEDVVKVGDRLDVKLIEINEKGHLRLSHRALLPDASPKEETGSKQQAGGPKENTHSQTTSEKVKTSGQTTEAKTATDGDTGKVVLKKKQVTSSKYEPYINKDRLKRSAAVEMGSGEAVAAEAIKGEAKTG